MKIDSDFCSLYEQNKENQELLLLLKGDKKTLPCDDLQMFSNNIQHLISEIGEVLEADKRWKVIRNKKYDRKNKIEEIADCYIALLNIAMYSDISGQELKDAIIEKIGKNKVRILEEQN